MPVILRLWIIDCSSCVECIPRSYPSLVLYSIDVLLVIVHRRIPSDNCSRTADLRLSFRNIARRRGSYTLGNRAETLFRGARNMNRTRYAQLCPVSSPFLVSSLTIPL